MTYETTNVSSANSVRSVIECAGQAAFVLRGAAGDSNVDPSSSAYMLLVSQQAALAGWNARYRRLVKRMSAVVFELDADGRTLFVNDSITEAAGYEPSEVLARGWWQTLYTGSRSAAGNDLRALLERGDVRRLNTSVTAKDGAERILELSTANRYARDGRLTSVLGFAVDVTARVRAERAQWAAEEALKTHVVDLEMVRAELLRSNRALNETVARLERANADLEQFAYAVSHDLKEPLRMVSAYTKRLGQTHCDRLDDEGRALIAFACDGAARMNELIDALLMYSRLTQHDQARASVDLNEVVASVLADLRLAIEEKQARIDVAPLPTVESDRVRALQLFGNLLSNAIKFASAAAPHIRVGATRRDGQWEFVVSDNGIGIAPQFHQRIFEVFQRLHTREEFPGAGIGLAICKRIVEQHQGRIWVASQPGQGAAFHFTIRDAEASAGS